LALSLSVLVGGLALVGCGSGDSGKQFSQDFPKPEGAAATVKADPGEDVSISEGRKKDRDESYKEAAKGKGKRRPR